MSDYKLQRLHDIYMSGTYGKLNREPHPDPRVQKLYNEPHLALFINGDWLPILPGMIIGMITDRTQIDGIAPYYFSKVNTKPGKEYIDLIAFSSDMKNNRTLRLGAKYAGQFVSGIRGADDVIDGAMNAKKMASEDSDED